MEHESSSTLAIHMVFYVQIQLFTLADSLEMVWLLDHVLGLRRHADIGLLQSHHAFPLSQISEGGLEHHRQLRLPSMGSGYISRPGQIRPLLQPLIDYPAATRLAHLSASRVIIIILRAPISSAEWLVSDNTMPICQQYARNILDPSILQVLKDLLGKLPPAVSAHPLPTTPRASYSHLPRHYTLNGRPLYPHPPPSGALLLLPTFE